MAIDSKIQWTNATWNPWHGCKKVSPGCKFCYMYRDKERYGHDPTTVLRSKTKFGAPLGWKEPKLIFTCSWSDWFIEEADAWRDEAWEIIKRTPQHTYQILTKRPERISQCLPEDWGKGYPNVWLGVSAENQETFNARLPLLIAAPARTKFISAEPLIGKIGLYTANGNTLGVTAMSHIDWMIIGGESGNDTGKYRYRDCNMYWIESLAAECSTMNVPVFVKQLGTYISKEIGLKDRHGGDISEWPGNLRIREFPESFKTQSA